MVLNIKKIKNLVHLCDCSYKKMIQVNDTHEGNFRLLGFLIKKSKFTIDLSLKVSSAKKTIFCHVVDVNVP